MFPLTLRPVVYVFDIAQRRYDYLNFDILVGTYSCENQYMYLSYIS